MTAALRAKDALTRGAVFSNIVKLDSSMTKRGCAYGLEIPCSSLGNAKSIFQRERIKIREYVEEG